MQNSKINLTNKEAQIPHAKRKRTKSQNIRNCKNNSNKSAPSRNLVKSLISKLLSTITNIQHIRRSTKLHHFSHQNISQPDHNQWSRRSKPTCKNAATQLPTSKESPAPSLPNPIICNNAKHKTKNT